MQSVQDVTYELLREFGLTTIFGNIGSTECPFLKNFPSDFRYVLALQEASVIGMADGFAQATSRPALVNVHAGPGMGNSMGALLTASQNKTPLIVTAGQQAREMVLMESFLTNVEATMLPRPWVKWAYEPSRAEDVPAAFMRAIATALQPPAGPVFLSLPLDDWDKPSVGPTAPRTVSRRVAPDRARLTEFADALSEASSPVLIYGAAIDRSDGWSEAVTVAEALGAPVWAAPISERVSFPENHPLYSGELPVTIGSLSQKLEGHDVALVVGAPVFRYYSNARGPYLPNGMRLLHISDDPVETARAPVGDSLLGDATLSLAALADLLDKRKSETERVQEKVAHRVAPHPLNRAKMSDGGLLTAAQVFNALSEIRPVNAILVEESPSNHADLHACWPIIEPASYFTAASGGLGFGLPASAGIALGERETGRNRPVITIMGDGSFQYSVQSLWTAAQQHLPIAVIVLRNYEYAILRSLAVFEDIPNLPGLDLPDLDIVSLAKGYGCDAARLGDLDGIKKTTAEAWTKSKPTVLEIPISPQVPPLF
ncbi:MAG: benzoylformate decarboxylase [Actinomycetota bacterium]|nr:benzoylformate decarboxylase [Actinomycetota bacterium]